jgi:hypothetical protein
MHGRERQICMEVVSHNGRWVWYFKSSSSSSISTTTLVGFQPAQLSSILSRKVLQSAVASGTSNPQHGGDGISNKQAYFH